MARWKVTAKHYIHAEQYGQPTEWERQEINQDTGRMFRKSYKVPMLIDPEDPYCVNKHLGMCTVATKGSEQPGDIVFFGPPTPDMEPLDEEARAITEKESPHWVNPIDGLSPVIGEDFGQQLLQVLDRQLSEAAAGRQVNVSMKGADNDQVTKLMEMLTAQQRQIDQLLQEKAPAADPLPPAPDPDALPERPPITVNAPRRERRV